MKDFEMSFDDFIVGEDFELVRSNKIIYLGNAEDKTE